MKCSTIRPKAYNSILDVKQTEISIKLCKEYFESNLAEAMNLMKVSAPMLLKGGNGLNDNLNGVERVVSFDALDLNETKIEVVQSLAKWKRQALKRYGIALGEGLYTDMNAIRRDETLDNLHSIYVDQWDWEKVISVEDRNLDTLKAEVKKIYQVMKFTEKYLHEVYSLLTPILPEEVFFITTQELEDMYPNITPIERENQIAKVHGAVFIMQIGEKLRSGEKHDGRSPDYDDWTLNGDIIFWYPVLERSVEVSSMGIRVDKKTLLRQLKLANNENRKALEYHKSIINGELPYTIGGGIGQSRLCMFFLKKAHIGEVQASVWNEQIISECKEGRIMLL